MTVTWMVILKSGERMDDMYCYGPFDDETSAQRFADFLTKEVDPAVPCLLRSPSLELMNWADSQ
jgi:hypothetical protein